jgi:hypothetical protein
MYNFIKLNLNYQYSSVPKPLFRKFARKQGFVCPGLLPSPAFGQTLSEEIIAKMASEVS